MIQGDGGGLEAAAAAAQGEEALRQASQGRRSRDPRRSRLRPSLCCSFNLFFLWRSQRGQVPQDGGARRPDEEAVPQEDRQAPNTSGPRQDHGGQVGQVLSISHHTSPCKVQYIFTSLS